MQPSCPERFLSISRLNVLICLTLSASLTLSACTSRVGTENAPLEHVETGGSQANIRAQTANMHEGDMATMEVVSNGCLKAWRKACAGDQKGSIAMLEDLDKHYPGVLTIQMMEGQVYQHFGKNDLAIEHYKKCVSGNEFSSFHMFKLAEAMRKNGDNKGAAAYYRKIIKLAPQFGQANVGLAKCLLVDDKNSGEARTALSEATRDEQSAKEAQKMLDELEPGARAGN
jgi:tetratricopeptide (TPR) repeat protein